MYLVNKDGFTLLAMGFSGKKALEFKLAFIKSRSIEYADNQISLYFAQKRKCAVTGESFVSTSEIYCHHKIPKVLEAYELFSAITKGTKYDCTFEFVYKIDRTVAAILESAKKRAWVDVK